MEMPVVDEGVFETLQAYEWKGNIRELKNIVESMTVLSENGKITMESIPKYIMKGVSPSQLDSIRSQDGVEDEFDLTKKIETIEKQTILKALEKADGKKAKAAKLLNIPRSTLYYKMELYNIQSL